MHEALHGLDIDNWIGFMSANHLFDEFVCEKQQVTCLRFDVGPEQWSEVSNVSCPQTQRHSKWLLIVESESLEG